MQGFAKIARQILREHPSASRLSSVDSEKDLDEVTDTVKSWLREFHGAEKVL
jgi:hypothetical protein